MVFSLAVKAKCVKPMPECHYKYLHLREKYILHFIFESIDITRKHIFRDYFVLAHSLFSPNFPIMLNRNILVIRLIKDSALQLLPYALRSPRASISEGRMNSGDISKIIPRRTEMSSREGIKLLL